MLFDARLRMAALSVAFTIGSTIACSSYTHATPEQVAAILDRSGIVGRTPDEAIRILHAQTFEGLKPIEVGRFNPASRRLDAVLTDTKRTLYQVWNINVTIRFDASGHALAPEVAYSAENPL